MTVPVSVNLIALSSRLTRICCSRKRSVAIGRRYRFLELHLDPQVLGFRLGPQRLDHVGDDPLRRTRLALDSELARLDPRNIQEVVDQRQQELTVLADGGEMLLDLGGAPLQVRMFTQQVD